MSIAKRKLGCGKLNDCLFLEVVQLDPEAVVFQLNAVSTDILYRGGSHPTRNQRQIFKTKPTLIESLHHSVMPGMPGTHLQIDIIACLHGLETLNFRTQDDPVKLRLQDN